MPRVAVLLVMVFAASALFAQESAPSDDARWKAWVDRKISERLSEVTDALEVARAEVDALRNAWAPLLRKVVSDDAAAAERLREMEALRKDNESLRARVRDLETAVQLRDVEIQNLHRRIDAFANPRHRERSQPTDQAASDVAAHAARLRERLSDLERLGAPRAMLDAVRAELEVATAESPSLVDPAPRAPLGVRVGPVAPEWRARRGVPEGVGVRVVEVVPGSEAERIGLKVDDVIVAAGPLDVRSADVLKAAWVSAGGPLDLHWRRNDEKLTGRALPKTVAVRTSPVIGTDDLRPSEEVELDFKRLEEEALRRFSEEHDGRLVLVPDSRPAPLPGRNP
ncbi:MAG TPA: hypothetical protein VEI02_16190 [Planctomycetota bacterium]|nr:hypothetical protein [Planctomycetota bacterium]